MSGLREVLDAHEAVGWMCDSRGRQVWSCLCGEGVDMPPEHTAHVEAAVLAWVRDRLASAEVFGAAMRAVYAAGDAPDYCHEMTDAALTAVREALTGEEAS